MEQDVSSLVNPIRAHLESKTDTERFVGLKLLISVLEKHPEIRQDQQQVRNIWRSVPPKFLDRLLKTACKPNAKDSQECLTIAVSVIHAFSLLVDDAGKDEKFTDRIPRIVPVLVYSSPEITELALQLLLTLTREPQGAKELIQIDDQSPLTEAAPSNRFALDVLRYAWLSSMYGGTFTQEDSNRVNENIKGLVASFSGTDATTLLDFIGDFLREADSVSFPVSAPGWLEKVVGYIHNLSSNRPTPEGRAAYTNAADSLLKTWPESAAAQLFSSKKQDEKALGHLFTKLILVDIRASLPVLLEQRSNPSSEAHAKRIVHAYDITSQLISFLIKLLENEDGVLEIMSFDHLMSLRKSIGETMEVSIEFLLEKFGLDQEAKRSFEDPLSLAALRALSLWIRENDDGKLRGNALSLMEVVQSCYRSSMETANNNDPSQLDFRGPCLLILQAIISEEEGPFEFNNKGEGGGMLLDDLITIGKTFISREPSDTSRWQDLIQVLYETSDKIGGNFEGYLPRLDSVAREFSKTLRAGEMPKAEDDEIREYEVAVCRFVADVLVQVFDLEGGSGVLCEEVRNTARGLYEQVVVVGGDTLEGSPSMKDIQSVKADLARIKDSR